MTKFKLKSTNVLLSNEGISTKKNFTHFQIQRRKKMTAFLMLIKAEKRI